MHKMLPPIIQPLKTEDFRPEAGLVDIISRGLHAKWSSTCNNSKERWCFENGGSWDSSNFVGALKNAILNWRKRMEAVSVELSRIKTARTHAAVLWGINWNQALIRYPIDVAHTRLGLVIVLVRGGVILVVVGGRGGGGWDYGLM